MPHNHRVIVKAWIEKNGKFLLALRGNTEAHNPGVWSLPGGNVELGEEDFVLEKTLKKEIKEEVGINVDDRMDMTYNNSFVKPGDGSHVVNVTFLCHWQSGKARPLEDTTQIKWFTLDQLKSYPNPPDFLIREITHLVRFLQKR